MAPIIFVTNKNYWPLVEEYIRTIVRRFKDDERILIWDVYNEPSNDGIFGDDGQMLHYQGPLTEHSLELCRLAVSWVRDEDPSQPLTVGAWRNMKIFIDRTPKIFEHEIDQMALELSDVITFHAYSPKDVIEETLEILVFPYLAAFFAEGRDDQGYLPAVMVLMGLGLVFMMNGYINTREKVRLQGDAAKVTLLQTFKVVKTNKPLFIILGIFAMNVFGNIANNLYVYFFTYNMGNGGLVAAVGTITICCSIACLITPVLTARFRKRDIFIVLCVLEIVARLGFYFSGYDSVASVIIWLSIVNIIFMMTNPLVSAMIADTVEYSYYHTGKRCAAITFAGQTFTGKLSVAIAGGFSGVLLTMLGYVPNASQSLETLDGIFFCIALLPVVGTIVRIVLLKMYTFNEEQHAELVKKINRGEFDITAKI